ncbi:MAG: hypothetical protein Kow00120_03240 [Anaerolineae bacterium]
MAHPGLPDEGAGAAQERVAMLQDELDALRASLPAHSVPPAMVLRIEELEEELEAALQVVRLIREKQ